MHRLAASAIAVAVVTFLVAWRAPGASPASATQPPPTPRRVAGSTIDRLTDGVVFELEQIPELAGTPLAGLHAASWDADAAAWFDAPFQVDERIERDRYVLVEHGVGEGIDGNDEFVALVRHLGGRAPVCAWPPGWDGADVRWDLEVSDPLDPGATGWLHVAAMAGDPQPVPTLLSWDRRSQTLTSIDYTLTQAKGYVGLESLSLFDSQVDVLDRSKVRADIYVHGAIDLPGPLPDPTFVFDENYTEESREIQQAAGDFVFRPVKQGPVRLVLEVDGKGFAYPGQVEVYAAFGRINLPRLPREVIQLVDKLQLEFRLSLDFAAAALPGRYADANATAGVPVDGRHDVVPEKPISTWRQVDTPYGGVVIIAAKPLALRSMGTYYNDRGRDEPPGTGDNKAYGDNGVFARELDAVTEAANFLGWIVIVPPGQEIVGERVQRELDTPLVVRAVRVAREDCMRATETPTDTATPIPPTAAPTRAPTVTALATASPTRTASPEATATKAPRVLLLPVALNGACQPGSAPRLDVVLLVDASSSMAQPTQAGGPTRLAAAKAAAAAFVGAMSADRARAAVVTFDGAARVVVPLTDDGAALRDGIASISTAEGTRIDLGLAAAAALLRDAPDDRDQAVVLLSDGGGEPDAALAEAAALRARGVRVVAIGVGDADMGLLGALASSPADVYAAPGPDALVAIYRSLASALSCPG